MTDVSTAAEFHLVPPGTVAEASGEGAPLEVSSTGPRLFVIRLDITEVVEQESLEFSILGSADGQTWGLSAGRAGAMPLLKFAQCFYRGSTQMALDLTARPEVRFLRAHWELNRWGRGRPQPRVRFGVAIQPAA